MHLTTRVVTAVGHVYTIEDTRLEIVAHTHADCLILKFIRGIQMRKSSKSNQVQINSSSTLKGII